MSPSVGGKGAVDDMVFLL